MDEPKLFDREKFDEEGDVEFEKEDDGFDEFEMVEPFDPSHIKIHTKQDTLHNLIERLRHDEIELNSSFQRGSNLWDVKKMSRLIESILIRFPLPAFYFDATDDDNWLVVDGLQRLSSIKKFVMDEKQPLKLKNLEYLTDLHGKAYTDLNRTHRRRIDECPVTYFQILPGTPEAVKYSIFRRINTGGLVLNNQEIRNALSPPMVRDFLRSLADNEDLKRTIGDKSKRMFDQELALRFLAFFHLKNPEKGQNITIFLDQMLGLLSSINVKDRGRLKKSFEDGLDRAFRIFGSSAFEKRSAGDDSSRRKRKSTSLFEVWSVSLAQLPRKQAEAVIANGSQVIQLHREAMDPNSEYFRAISFATQKREHIDIRYKVVSQIIEKCSQ